MGNASASQREVSAEELAANAAYYAAAWAGGEGGGVVRPAAASSSSNDGEPPRDTLPIDSSPSASLLLLSQQPSPSSLPWRSAGIKHKRNEIFMDIHDTLDVALSSSHAVTSCTLSGSVFVKSHLSGMPHCKVGLVNDNSQFPAIHIDRFHPCVDQARFNAAKPQLCFVPPDGSFELLHFQPAAPAPCSSPLLSTPPHVVVHVTAVSSTPSAVVYTLSATFRNAGELTAWDVAIVIPLPDSVHGDGGKYQQSLLQRLGSSLTVDSADQQQQQRVAWKLRSMQHGKQYTAQASFARRAAAADFHHQHWQQHTADEQRLGAITASFRVCGGDIPAQAACSPLSRIRVSYHQVRDKDVLRYTPWARYAVMVHTTQPHTLISAAHGGGGGGA